MRQHGFVRMVSWVIAGVVVVGTSSALTTTTPAAAAAAPAASCPTVTQLRATPSKWITNPVLTQDGRQAVATYGLSLPAGCAPPELTLVSYTAPNGGDLTQQRVYAMKSGTAGPLRVDMPACEFQVDLIIGDSGQVISKFSPPLVHYHARHVFLAVLKDFTACRPAQDDVAPTVDALTLTTNEDTPVSTTLRATDADGYAPSFGVDQRPAHGKISIDGTRLTYTPDPGYSGPDSTTYQASDGVRTSAAKPIAIQVLPVNAPPVLAGDQFTAVGTGRPAPVRPVCTQDCAVFWGDPHLTTFDRLVYDFQPVGEFDAVRSGDLVVQLRTRPFPNSRLVSMVQAAAMTVGRHRVNLVRDGATASVHVDGAVVGLSSAPYLLTGGGRITRFTNPDQTIVEWPDGSFAVFEVEGWDVATMRLAMEMHLVPARRGHVTGLFGDWNGATTNDLTTRDGHTIPSHGASYDELYHQFANSWRVTQATSLFDYAAGQTTATFTDLTFPDHKVDLSELTPEQRDAGNAACTAYGVQADGIRDACVLDVGLTGNPDFAGDSAAAQQAAQGSTMDTGLLIEGVADVMHIDTAGGAAARSYRGRAGEIVTITASGSTLPGAQLQFRSPGGALLGGGPVPAGGAFFGPITLPSTGTYTLGLTGAPDGTGHVTVLVSDVAANTGTTAIGAPTTVRTTTPGEVAKRTFTASAGQHLDVRITGNTYHSVAFSVVAPDGSRVASTTVSTPTAFIDTFTLPSTGTYTVTIDPDEQQVGALTFVLEATNAGTGTVHYGVPETVTTTAPGENATRTFAGTAGQQLTVTFSAVSYSSVFFRVSAPDNSSVTGGFVASPTDFFDTFTLPSTGTYTITVDPQGQVTGALTFVLGLVPANTGTTAVGTSTTVRTTVPGENATRTFAGTAGQLLTASFSGVSYSSVFFRLSAPDNSSVTGGFVASPTDFFDTFTLPSTGTYTITVDPQGQGTGAMTFLLGLVPANTGTTAIGTSTTVRTTVPGENATRTFTGTAGQLLTATFSAVSYSSVFFRVAAPNGSSVVGGFVGSPTAFFDTFTLPSTGTYTITVDPQGQGTGALTFVLGVVPANTGTTAIGTSTTVRTTVPGENATRTFTGTAGQLLTATFSGVTYTSVFFRVAAPNGSSVAGGFVGSPTDFFDTFTLPSTGTYTITVDPQGQGTGALTFLLGLVPANTGTTTIGTSTTVRTTVPGENATRTFSGTAGQRLTVTFSGVSYSSVFFRVSAPDNSSVTGGFVASPTDFFDTFTLPSTGTYTITVDPQGQVTGALTFVLGLVPANTGTTAVGTSTTVRTTVPGENATRTFAGTAGQLLTASFSGVSYSSVFFRIAAPNGNGVVGGFVGSPTDFFDTFTMPSTGTYTITVDPQGQGTGALTFVLNTAAADHAHLPIGTPTVVAVQKPGGVAIRTFTATAGDRVRIAYRTKGLPRTRVTVTPHRGHATRVPARRAGLVLTAKTTGTYSVLVDPPGRRAGRFVLTVTLRHAKWRPHAQLSSAAAATPDPHRLSITDAQLLANDTPGSVGEAQQHLSVTGVTATGDTHGTVSRTAGVTEYVPANLYVGPASFTYTACDSGTTDTHSDARCGTATVLINVVPDAVPTANDTQVTVAEDHSVHVTLTGADADGDPLTYTVVQSVVHGTLTGTAPDLTYAPAADFNGTDLLRFQTNDGSADSTPGTVTLAVTEVNDPPSTSPDALVARPGVALTVTPSVLLGNDTTGPPDEQPQTLQLTAVHAIDSTHGTVTRAANGNVVYTAQSGFQGAAGFTYTACDNGTTAGHADPQCADGTVTVTVAANTPPTAVPASISTAMNTAVAVHLNAVDADSPTLTYGIGSQPAHGTLSGTAPALTYTPATGYTGSDSFTFTANDGTSTSAPAVITLQILDTTPPTITDDSARVAPGASATIDVLANDTAAIGTLDASTLRVTTAPTSGHAVAANGKVSYTAPATAGTDTFTYRVCDQQGVCGSAVVTVTISGANHAPSGAPDSYAAQVHTTLSVAPPGVLANDSDPDQGDHMSVRLVTGVRAGQLLLVSSGRFTYTPGDDFTGTDSFTYKILDDAGAESAPVTVTITVAKDGVIAGDDTYSTQRDVPLIQTARGVLTNDRSETAGPVSATLHSDANHGRLALNGDGSFVYEPDPGYVGIDQFTYVMTDVAGHASDPAFVDLTVTAPTAPLPELAAVTPNDGTRVGAPTPIGANITPPSGQTISSWTVWIRNLDHGVPTKLASGSGTPPARLATFDPTTRINGAYQVIVEAQASGGGISSSTSSLIVIGHMKLGQYTTSNLDLSTTVAGVPLQIVRAYDSTDTRSLDFSPGWKISLASYGVEPNNRLGLDGWSTTRSTNPFEPLRFSTSKPHFITVTSPDGTVDTFDLLPAPTSGVFTLTTPEFVARPGTAATLEDVDAPILTVSNGSLTQFLAGDIYNPRLFRLRTPDGTVAIIDRFDGLQSVTDRYGNEVSVDGAGVHSSAGVNIVFARDGAQRVTSITGLGHTVRYAYSAAGDLSTVTLPDGTTQTFTYDGLHRLLTESVDGKLITQLRYDSAGHLLSVSDGEGNTKRLTPDPAAHRVTVFDQAGRLATTTTYNANGDPVRRDRVFGGHTVTTSATFDAVGHQLSATDALGSTTRYTYDSAGNILTETDPNGNVTTTVYNAAEQPTKVSDSLGTLSTHTYDSAGNETASTDGTGATTTYTYDMFGLLLTERDPTGRTTSYSYDATGRVAAVTDPAGRRTVVTRNAAGLISSVTNPLGARTAYSYDARDNLTQVVDANGHAHQATYDAMGRLASQTDSLGATLRNTYNSTGRLTQQTDRNGVVTRYTYDPDGRLSGRTSPDESDVYAYDPLGRLTEADNAAVKLSYTYDDAGDVLTATAAGTTASPGPTSTFTYTYDAAGRQATVTGPGGKTTYRYDGRNEVTSVIDSAAGVLGISYDGNGQPSAQTRPNGVKDTIKLDAGGNVTSINSVLNNTVVSTSSYGYNQAGLRTAVTTDSGADAFGYDAAGQLTSATYPAATGIAAQSFTYDKVGNRTSTATAPAGSFSYDSADRVLSDGTSDYTYDKQGNVLTKTVGATHRTTRYTWTAQGKLARVDLPDGTSSTYRYDALGHLVQTTKQAVATHYAYDGDNIAAEYDTQNALAATYVHAGAQPTVLEMVRQGQRYFYSADALGSTTTITTASGAVADRYTYDAFGATSKTGTVANPFTFTGQLDDGATGLILFPLRAYDPAQGRFLSEDPSSAVNPYPYVANNPVNLVDPTGGSIGKSSLGLFACAAIAIGAAYGGPGGVKGAKEVADCALKIIDAIDKRKKQQEAVEKIVQFELEAEEAAEG